jgi:hypothetical protein
MCTANNLEYAGVQFSEKEIMLLSVNLFGNSLSVINIISHVECYVTQNLGDKLIKHGRYSFILLCFKRVDIAVLSLDSLLRIQKRRGWQSVV